MTVRLDIYVKNMVYQIERDVSANTPYSQMAAQKLLSALEVLDFCTYQQILDQGRFAIDSMEYVVDNHGYVLI